MKKVIMGFVLLMIVNLAGCSGESSVEKQLAEAMTEMNNAEKIYRKAQVKLTNLEEKEQSLFNESMVLTQQQRSELTEKVAKLEELLAQRLVHLEDEETSISEAKASVSNFDAIIEQADEQQQKAVEELKAAVNKRYELHSVFVSAYEELAELQQELYGMLSSEQSGLMELKGKVDEVNAQNETVQTAVASFNELTSKVNILIDDMFVGLQGRE